MLPWENGKQENEQVLAGKRSTGKGGGQTADRQCARKEVDRVKELPGTWWQASAWVWWQLGDSVQDETREPDVPGGENSSFSPEHWEATAGSYVEQGKTRLVFWKDPPVVDQTSFLIKSQAPGLQGQPEPSHPTHGKIHLTPAGTGTFPNPQFNFIQSSRFLLLSCTNT